MQAPHQETLGLSENGGLQVIALIGLLGETYKAIDRHRVKRTLRATLNTDIDRHRVNRTLRATLNTDIDRHRVNRTEGSFRFIHNFFLNALLLYIIYITKITNIHNKFTSVLISIRLNVLSFQKAYSLLLT